MKKKIFTYSIQKIDLPVKGYNYDKGCEKWLILNIPELTRDDGIQHICQLIDDMHEIYPDYTNIKFILKDCSLVYIESHLRRIIESTSGSPVYCDRPPTYYTLKSEDLIELLERADEHSYFYRYPKRYIKLAKEEFLDKNPSKNKYHSYEGYHLLLNFAFKHYLGYTVQDILTKDHSDLHLFMQKSWYVVEHRHDMHYTRY